MGYGLLERRFILENASLVTANVKNIIFNMANFLILFFIIKHFFYEKINGFIQKRSDDVSLEMKNAQALKAEAEGYKAEYSAKLAKAEERSKEIIEEAINTAKDRKSEIIEEANKEAMKIQERAKAEINLEKKKALEEVRGNIVDLTMYATEKVIKESLHKAKHEQLILDSIKKVGEVK